MENRKEPNLVDKARSLGTAVYNWAAKDGLHRVSPQVLEFRKNICNSCEHWDKEAFGYMGKCNICGCSAAKLYIPSASCPLPTPKWNSITSTDPRENSIYLEKKPSLVVTRSQPTGSNY